MFFLNQPASTEIYPLSLPAALPICANDTLRSRFTPLFKQVDFSNFTCGPNRFQVEFGPAASRRPQRHSWWVSPTYSKLGGRGFKGTAEKAFPGHSQSPKVVTLMRVTTPGPILAAGKSSWCKPYFRGGFRAVATFCRAAGGSRVRPRGVRRGAG